MKLGNYITQIRGVSYKPSDVTTIENGLPILRANNINNDEMNFDDLIYIEPSKIKDNQILRIGDVFVCASSGSKSLVGKACLYKPFKNKISFGAFCKVIRINNSININPDFIRLFFRSNYYREQISELSKGANINNIKSEDIDSLEINIPSIEVQNEAILIINSLINALNNKKNEYLLFEEMIKSRFIELFENKGFPLIEIKKVVDTKKISAKKKYLSDESIEYIDISSIDNVKNIIIGSTSYIFEKAPSRAQQCLLREDILISTVRPNLKNIALFNIDNEGYVGSSGFCVLRSTKCNPYYLLHCVLSDDFTNSMCKLTSGASYPAIRDEDVFNYKIINAPIELQNKFADFVKLIDKSKFDDYSRYFL